MDDVTFIYVTFIYVTVSDVKVSWSVCVCVVGQGLQRIGGISYLWITYIIYKCISVFRDTVYVLGVCT